MIDRKIFNDPAIKYDYEIVYVRTPRKGNAAHSSRWADASLPLNVDADGDLMLLHFRPSFDELNQAELCVAQLQLGEFLEPTTSYLSVVELGLYESTVRLNATLEEKGIAPGTPEWEQETEQVLEQRRQPGAEVVEVEAPGGIGMSHIEIRAVGDVRVIGELHRAHRNGAACEEAKLGAWRDSAVTKGKGIVREFVDPRRVKVIVIDAERHDEEARAHGQVIVHQV